MADVFVVADNIVSPLGVTTVDNFRQLTNQASGVQLHDDKALAPEPVYASLFGKHTTFTTDDAAYTKFEALLIASIKDALQQVEINPADKKTLLIISSTKGNIGLLETETLTDELKQRISLQSSANIVATHFGFINTPLIVSNACISGLLAIITGARLIQAGIYENVVVAGADVISRFIMSGFQSFQAISAEPCKPFDENRVGITLGEGAGTVVLSAKKISDTNIKVAGGATGNDANHISGPSRTGEELSYVIRQAMQEAGVSATEIDFISAHGTATIYNDEMEAKAIALAGLAHAPVNSLKGNYGHTLGAAGLIESIITMQSMKAGVVLPTPGFEQLGVSAKINVAKELQEKTLTHCLKTASGFGGCNGAIVFSKI